MSPRRPTRGGGVPVSPGGPRTGAARPFGPVEARGARLRSPLLIALWTLLAFEAAGGLLIFGARVAAGQAPGETLHVVGGAALTLVYALYQWRHWARVRPFRPQLDYSIGLLAALFMALTNLTGLWLGVSWWRDRIAHPITGAVRYPAAVSAAHDIGTMLVLTFVGGHVATVLLRDRRPSGAS